MEETNKEELLLVLYSMLELLENGLTESAARVLKKTIAQLEKEGTKEDKTEKANE